MRSFSPLLITIALAVSALPATAQPYCGDCDELGNGIDILDSLEAARIAAGLDVPGGTQGCTCDLDGSALINVVDALLIAQIAAGIPVTISCGPGCQGPCPGTVSLRGPAAPVRCGLTTTLFIDADLGWCDLGAYQMRLVWDPTVLDLDRTYGVLGVLQTPLGVPAVVNDAIPGEVTFNGVFPCLSTFATSLANVRFDVIGVPSSSTMVTLEVDDLTRCDTSTIGPPNPRVAGAIAVQVAAQACFVPCSATGVVTLVPPPGGAVPCAASFEVDLTADLGSCDLGAYEFQLDWDPAVIGLDTGFGQQGVLFTPAGALQVVDAAVPGRVVFSALFSCPQLGASSLATIGFEALAIGGGSTAIDVTVRDLARCDTSTIGPANPRMGTGTMVNIGSCGPVVTVTACGQVRNGSFATGLQVVDVADDTTTDYFRVINLPLSTQQITIATTGTGDMDLYVGAPGVPGGSQVVGDYPLRSLTFTSAEQIVLTMMTSPSVADYLGGEIAVAVHAWDPGSYSLTITCGSTPPPVGVQLPCDTEITDSLATSGFGTLGTSGSTDFYFVDPGQLPAGLTELVLITGGMNGDIDLYVGRPGTPVGSTSAAGYIQLTGDSSHHSYVMPASEVATYGAADIAIAVHADRAGDYRLRSVCLTPGSTFRYVRNYVYTVGASLSSSVSNGNPTGRDRFNQTLEHWARIYRDAPAPEMHCAFELRQWSDPSSAPYENLNFDIEAQDLAAHTGLFPTNPNRPPGPHTFYVETLTSGGSRTLGISYVDISGVPGTFGAGNAVELDRTTFAVSAVEAYILGVAAAHECGHYMSVVHTTDFSSFCDIPIAFDSHSDTPQCTGFFDCTNCQDSSFLMFPAISGALTQEDVSQQQENAMETNPCVR